MRCPTCPRDLVLMCRVCDVDSEYVDRVVELEAEEDRLAKALLDMAAERDVALAEVQRLLCMIPAGSKEIERVEALTAMLRELEWSGDSMVDMCPSCGGRPVEHGDGHAADCKLAKLLHESEADT